MKRIDSLEPNTNVTLRFVGRYGNGTYDEPATFLRIEGEGSAREAVFRQDDNGRSYEWNAYRFDGGWAFGTSAERLQLVEIHGPAEKS